MINLVPKDSLIGVIVGPVVWAVFFVVCYLITGIGCSLEPAENSVLGLSGIDVLVLLATALAAVVIGIALIQAARAQKVIKQQDDATVDERRRQAFLYATSMLLSAFSLTGVLWLGVNALIVPGCN